ncbi:R8 protein [Coemansia sp. RSA 2322]|nr:R8 protein [Coemansia sp. RSA 2322]
MFYSQDLLCRRNGHFAAVWLLAHASARTRSRYVSIKDIVAIDISRMCVDVLHPPAPLSLRLSSTLLLGLAQTLSRQIGLLYADCHAVRARIVSTPWVAANRTTATQNTLPLDAAVATSYAIALPDAVVPEYASWHNTSEHWMAATIGLFDNAESTSRLHTWHRLGWLSGDAAALQEEHTLHLPDSSPLRVASAMSGASYTALWDSTSIPDAEVCRSMRPPSVSDSPGLLLLASSSPGNQRLPSDHGVHLDHEAEDPSFHFDHNGNLQFERPDAAHSRHMSLDEDPHTEILYQLSSDPLLMPPAISDLNPVLSSQALKSLTGSADILQTLPHSKLPLSQASEHALEMAEVAVLCNPCENDSPPPTKRQRLSKRRLAEIASAAVTATYVQRVPELWGKTCIWHKETRSARAAKAAKQAHCQVAHQVDRAAKMYAASELPALAHLLDYAPLAADSLPNGLTTDASPPNSPICGPDPLGDYSDNDSVLAHAPADQDLELELGRGGHQSTDVLQEDDEPYSDINLDIPWLNPSIFDTAQHRRSVGHTLSIRTESSPEPAHFYNGNQRRRQLSVSSQDTSASRALSLDPPLSDDGIEIRPFQLAAHNLGPVDAKSSPPSLRGLDSFLDTSRVAVGAAADVVDLNATNSLQLDKESSSFRQFTLAQMEAQGSNVLAFDDLLQHPYRNQRVAARAFSDLLQMASISAFGVAQREPFAVISIFKP